MDRRVDVVALGLAAVKGTQHLARPATVLDERGPVGDRRLCVVDVERAEVLRTVRNRSLIGVRARGSDEGLDLVLPDGRSASGPPVPTGETLTCEYWGRTLALELTVGPHSDLLSEHLGRPVRLARSPVGVVYARPVSLVSTASLRDLAERAGRDDLLPTSARFRMTAVVEAGDEPYAEDRWIGHEVTVGDAVVRVEGPVPRCAVIDLDPATGDKDGSLLKTLAGYRPGSGGEPWFGVDATVVRPGVLAV